MEMCVEDDEDYIKITFKFGLDPTWRAAVVKRIEQAWLHLFQKREVVGASRTF